MADLVGDATKRSEGFFKFENREKSSAVWARNFRGTLTGRY